ncbi:hypothetical protein VE01_08691 [Pseudogymnoascus verrucosus]|uniref:Zn(2)-C6 fungal-type domain-containing protein n=1 Tax=Pseudogymnoascus verrucosus TaxID=342668 RepID=A0A1B8GCC8_9PEZI|nr:uncharacterized protein VE01_08691 [Pseudogymnoascus verrucosus]OBT93486.1 hypothetical protein VE01_08691 [Pseudogymnoascus verrucosus]
MDARARYAHINSGTFEHAGPLEVADDEGASGQVLQRGEIRRVGDRKDLAHISRIQRTIGQRKRMLGMVKAGVITTSAGTVERVVDNRQEEDGGSATPTPSGSWEEQRGVKRKVDACGHAIPEEEFDELIEPKVESPGDDAALALIESHRRSMELMSPVAAKRPRGRPRKHPVVPESLNKITKGRSKTGCITCRKRKKKCDEAKPRCNNCEKNAVVCEGYPERAIWKSGKEKAEEGTAVWSKDISTSMLAQSTAQLSRVCIPNIQLQPVIHGVDTAGDRIFFEHYVFRLSAVLTVEGPQKNAFKDMLLPMAVKHLGLMHSILALSSSNLDYQSEYGRAILAKHPDVTENSLCERALFHQEEAVKEFVLDIERQNSGTTENVVLSVRYGQMLCFVVKSLTEGKTTGEHRVHLQAYQKLIRETPPEDSPFMDFIKEYFQFHISVDELVHRPASPPLSSTSSPAPDDDSSLSLPPALFQPEAECLMGVQDNLFYFMSSITRLRNKIRINIESDIDPIVDYNALYRASQIDASIRAWQSAWPVGEVRHVAGLLYKQMLWVYLWRSIYPPKATRWAPDTKITSAVNGALELLKLIPANDPCQTVVLTPTFIIGCAAFEPEQRIPIRESIRRIRAYTTLRNADRALEVLEEVWRYMDKRDERSWDWQGIASDMGMDFLAT